MELIINFFLGAVQGLTEFLPISSSGHLVVGQKLLGIETHDLFLDILTHLGTLFVIFIYYRKELLHVLKESLRLNADILKLIFWALVGCLPAILLGLSLKNYILEFFDQSFFVGLFFVFTALVLYLTKWARPQISEFQFDELLLKLNVSTVLKIGVAQSLALFPGISRSGMTVSTALFCGLSPKESAFFSFLMAIPLILGVSLVSIMDISSLSPQFSVFEYSVSFLSSMAFGIVGLFGIVRFLETKKLHTFSYYLVPLGLFVILF